jgi:hypothetical protein
MGWTFEQSTGEITDPDGVLRCIGYAGGNCCKNPEGINNPDMQQIHLVGPLPVGLYRFGVPVEGSRLGAFAIPLLPDSSNEMFGRSAFFVHGDTSLGNRDASEGCIIAPRAVRQAMHDSPNNQIKVVA